MPTKKMGISGVKFSKLTGINLEDNDRNENPWDDNENRLFESFEQILPDLDNLDTFFFEYHDPIDFTGVSSKIPINFFRFVEEVTRKGCKRCFFSDIKCNGYGMVLSIAMACDSLEEARGIISAYMVHSQ